MTIRLSIIENLEEFLINSNQLLPKFDEYKNIYSMNLKSEPNKFEILNKPTKAIF
mgnify:CR=1 FL=1